MRAIGLSTIAAIAIQPFVFWLWFLLPLLFFGAPVGVGDVLSMALYVLAVASAFVAVLGIPIFLILRWLHRARALSLSMSGFFAGAIPLAIYTWPVTSSYSGYSSGGNWYGRYVEFFVNGNPTAYGWLNYAHGVAMFGLHGLIGGLMFFWVWRYFYYRASEAT